MLCTHCREAYTPPPELIEELQLHKFSDSNHPVLYKATGCKQCANTGYYGRTIIKELLILSEPIRRLILAHADGTEIQQTAIKEGMVTMKNDGIKKALQGITTLEEVIRVTQDA